MNGHVSCIFLRAHTYLSLSLSLYIYVCVSTCADMHIHMHIDKQPGGWETALAVKHFLKKNSSGAVAPCTFYDEHYLKFSRGNFNDFEGMT